MTQGGFAITPTCIVPPLIRSSVPSGSRGKSQPLRSTSNSRTNNNRKAPSHGLGVSKRVYTPLLRWRRASSGQTRCNVCLTTTASRKVSQYHHPFLKSKQESRNGEAPTRRYRSDGQRHLPRHHDLGRTEQRSRRPPAVGLRSVTRHQLHRYR